MASLIQDASDEPFASLSLHGAGEDALDPNGILSPDTEGIWPQAMRER